MEVLRRLDMLTVIVGHDVRVTQRTEDRKLGMELLSLFLRHTDVIDLLSTEDLPIDLSVSNQVRMM